jgi:hypothetical protein
MLNGVDVPEALAGGLAKLVDVLALDQMIRRLGARRQVS